MLTFETLSCNPTQLIRKKFVRTKVFIPRVLDTLDGVLARGGYISGGSARVIGRWLFSELAWGTLPDGEPRHKNDDPLNRVEEYLVMPTFRIPKEHDVRLKNRFWKSGAGDIDFYFRTDDASKAVLNYLNKEVDHYKILNMYPAGSCPTLAGWGVEYFFGNLLIQAITKVTDEPTFILDSFDIVNAQCYLDNKGFHYTKRWFDCEKRGELEIYRGDKDNLIWRSAKWSMRHDLRISSESQKLLSQTALKLAQKINSEDGMMMWNRKVNIKQLQGKVKEMIWRWDSENILMASLILDSYDQLDLMSLIANKNRLKTENEK